MKYEGAAGKEIYINGGKVRNQGIELTASYIFAPQQQFQLDYQLQLRLQRQQNPHGSP